MIYSMTAFARKDRHTENGVLVWELKTVNHRYLEVSPRLPESLRELETTVREQCRHCLARGKVEVTLRYTPAEDGAGMHINEAMVRALAEANRTIGDIVQHPGAVNTMDILRYPGVLATPEADMESTAREARALLGEALEDLLETRRREGERLRELVLERLDGVTTQAARVREALPGILSSLRERLRGRVAEVVESPDPERLEQEIVLLAQKMDVDEELDRLATHVTEVRRVLEQGGTVGRRLDFLMQELNREANTLASKSVASETTQAAVELKVLIEQMREQIQNIE